MKKTFAQILKDEISKGKMPFSQTVSPFHQEEKGTFIEIDSPIFRFSPQYFVKKYPGLPKESPKNPTKNQQQKPKTERMYPQPISMEPVQTLHLKELSALGFSAYITFEARLDRSINWPLSKQDLKKIYRRAARKHHPDIPGGDAENFRDLTESFQILLKEF